MPFNIKRWRDKRLKDAKNNNISLCKRCLKRPPIESFKLCAPCYQAHKDAKQRQHYHAERARLQLLKKPTPQEPNSMRNRTIHPATIMPVTHFPQPVPFDNMTILPPLPAPPQAPQPVATQPPHTPLATIPTPSQSEEESLSQRGSEESRKWVIVAGNLQRVVTM